MAVETVVNYQTLFKSWFSANKTNLMKSLNTFFKQQSIWGESCEHFNTEKYYMTFLYGVLITQDISHNKDAQTWEYYKNKFEFDEIKKCFACNGINLTDSLKPFGFPFTTNTNGGIEYMGIEDTFEIEPSSSTTTINIPISTLLQGVGIMTCTLYVECLPNNI